MSTKHALAVLDDRDDTRQTTVNTLKRVLKAADWVIIEAPLSKTPEEVADWLVKQNVRVLIADQVLNEQKAPGGGVVNYKGSEVTAAVRKRLPDIPIYLLTAHVDDADIPQNLGKIEAVIHRGEFSGQAPAWMERMMRAADAFINRDRALLTRLSELSQKSATSKLNAEEAKELGAVQTALEINVPETSRAQVLSEVEAELGQLAALQQKVEKLVKKKQ